MPNPDSPEIERWVPYLASKVGRPDIDTYFVGHSVGGQTVLRYLEGLEANEKVGGVLLAASWINLKKASFEKAGDEKIAKPWIETPIKWKRILDHTRNFTAIFSDDDPYVPLKTADIFKQRLGAKIVFEHNKGHLTDETGIKKLDSIRDELLLLMERPKI
jgi:predicted alpha/beta hydrolase family esterase